MLTYSEYKGVDAMFIKKEKRNKKTKKNRTAFAVRCSRWLDVIISLTDETLENEIIFCLVVLLITVFIVIVINCSM